MFQSKIWHTNRIGGLSYISAFLFFLYICYACIHSIYYGVEPYDEAFYLAESYHLTLGQYFFTYFHRISHFVALFPYPFIKAFVYITGSTEGIFLYSRYVYSLFSISIAFFIAYLLKKKFTFPVALVIASVCVIFTPFNIHSMSYNTLAMLFLTLSLFLNFYIVIHEHIIRSGYKHSRTLYILLFTSSLIQFFITVTYPPLVIIYLITIASLWPFLFNKKGKDLLGAYLSGMACGGLAVLFLVTIIGAQPFFTDLSITASYGVQGGGLNKIRDILYNVWLQLPHPRWVLITISLFIISTLCTFRGKKIVQLVLVVGILFGIRIPESLFYIRYLALISPFLFITIKENKLANVLFYTVTIPSLIAGLITSWSSSNGVINSVIGLLPAALTTLCYFVLLMRDFYKNRLHSLLIIIALIVIIYPLKISNQLYNYSDFPSNQLPAKIVHGVFAGLYTTEEKKNYYETLQQTLAHYTKNNKSILFFDDFPLGYLMTKLIPATNSTWTVSLLRYPNYNRNATLEYLEKNNILPDIIVKIISVADNPENSPYSYKYLAKDPLNKLTKHDKLIYKSENYKIYKK